MSSKPIPICTTVEPPLHKRLEDWRRAQPSLMPRTDALRILLKRALDHEGKTKAA
jgi:hypothetical protein